jgi:hypothetical protein
MKLTLFVVLPLVTLAAFGCGGAGDRLPITDRSKKNSETTQSKLLNAANLSRTCGDSKTEEGKEILDLNAVLESFQSEENQQRLGRTFISSVQIFNRDEYRQGRYVDIKDQTLMRTLFEYQGFGFVEDRAKHLAKLIEFKGSDECTTITNKSETAPVSYKVDLETSTDSSLIFSNSPENRFNIRLDNSGNLEITSEFTSDFTLPCGGVVSAVVRTIRVFQLEANRNPSITLRKEIYETLSAMTNFPSLLDGKVPDEKSRNPNTVEIDLEILRLFDQSLENARTGKDNVFEIQKLACEKAPEEVSPEAP